MVRRSRGDRGVTVVVIGFTAAGGLLDAAAGGTPTWLGIPATVFFSVALLLAVVFAVDVARSGPRSEPLLRIGPAGVTVPGAPPVPWSDITSIRITRGGWPSTIRAVAFIPRPGRQVPAVRASGLRKGPVGRGPHAAAAKYGSALVVLPHLMTATASQTVDAARRWGVFDPPTATPPGADQVSPPTDRAPR